jgi:hypothetical protein
VIPAQPVLIAIAALDACIVSIPQQQPLAWSVRSVLSESRPRRKPARTRTPA